MSIKITREDTPTNKVAIFEPIDQSEPSIYDLAFLHIEVRWIREYGLNELELLVFGFINSYKPSTGRIYFSNAQLGKMFNKSEVTISRTISSLKEKELIDVEMQSNSMGGTIRYLRPKADLSNLTRGVIKNEEGGYQKRLPNSNINSNINRYICSFEEFWNIYPKKVSKKKAGELYKRVVTSKEKEKVIMDSLLKYKNKWRAEKTDIKYIPNPTTWLNQERWEDEVVISNEQFNKNARVFEKEMEVKKREDVSHYLTENSDGQLVPLAQVILGHQF